MVFMGNRRKVLTCEGCVFKSSHPDGIDFCLALAEFLSGDVMCNGDRYKQPDNSMSRYDNILEFMKELE